MAEPKFEEAFQKLEAIVKKLEEGNLSLEESLKSFEEGVRLSRFCSKKLDEAEKKVEILLKASNGRLVPKPFALENETEGD
jgi:exodeoxyribonuclease VII small subunit